LERTASKPPYILVGASWGAIYAKAFAAKYAREMAGLVLIDGEDERENIEFDRADKISPAERAKKNERLHAEWKKKDDASSREWLGAADLFAAGNLNAFGPMPDIPMAVLTSLKGIGEADAKEKSRLEIRRRLQSEVFQSTTVGIHLVTSRARHAMYQDDPELVANAILWVLNTARKK
jgi:pimeloyl-ACP methyl ester carboxylesterase